MKDLLTKAISAQRAPLRLAIVCAVLAALAAVGLLAVSGRFLAGAGLAGLAGAVAVQGFNYLLPSAFIRAAAITRTATRYGERMLGHRAALFALADVRAGLFARVAGGVLAGREAGRSGDAASRLAGDVDALEDAVIRRVSVVGAWAAGLGGVAASLAMGWRAALVLVAAMAAMRLCAGVLARRLLPAAQARVAEAHAALKADYAEIAVPVADIAVYDLAPALAEALVPAREAHGRARLAVARAEALIAATQALIAGLALAGMLLVCRADAAALAGGLLGAMAALEIWSALAGHAMRAQQVRLAEQRLAALPSGEARLVPLPPAPTISLMGRDFAPGARVLVAGRSGAGKTRLVETLAGLRADAPQALAVAGHDPRELGLASLREVFAPATQDAPLIAGSVADNLMLAHSGLDEADLWRALEVACVDDVVRALPDGLGQWLGGDGARLSGGQRRRIALARALLAGKPWLVLDEPSEGLDAATEARLLASLQAWLDATGKGLLLISHRPAMAALATETVTL